MSVGRINEPVKGSNRGEIYFDDPPINKIQNEDLGSSLSRQCGGASGECESGRQWIL